MVQPLWKTVWMFLKKLRIELLYNTTTPRLISNPPQIGNIYSQRYMHFYVHYSIIHGGQDMETTKVSSEK